MKRYAKFILTLTFTVVVATGVAMADTEEKMVIALKTDHFEMAETDISALAIGEAKTIETESGKIIDIIRTTDGAEIYVDGELLEMDFDHEGIHEEHKIRKHVEIICEDDEDCDKHIVMHAESDTNVLEWVGHGGDHVVIHKEVELSCTDDESGNSCSDSSVWKIEGEDIDLEELRELHEDGEAHQVIIIKKNGNSDS